MANANDVNPIAVNFVEDLTCTPLLMGAFRLRLREYLEKDQDDEVLDSWLGDSAGYPGASMDDLEAALAFHRERSIGYWFGQYTLTSEGRVFGALDVYKNEIRINGAPVKVYSYEGDRLTWSVQDGVPFSGSLHFQMTGDAHLKEFASGSSGREVSGTLGLEGETPARVVATYGTTYVTSFGARAALRAEGAAEPDPWNGDYVQEGTEEGKGQRLVVDLAGGIGKVSWNGKTLAVQDYSKSGSSVVNGRPEPQMLVWDDTAGPSGTKGKVTFSQANKQPRKCSGTVTEAGKDITIDLTAATLAPWSGTYTLKPFPSGASTFPELVLDIEKSGEGKISYAGIGLLATEYSTFGTAAKNGMRSRNVLVWDDSAGSTKTRGELTFFADEDHNNVFAGWIRSGSDVSTDNNVCGAMVEEEGEPGVKTGVDWTILIGTWLTAAITLGGLLLAGNELRTTAREAREHRESKKKEKADPSPKNKKEAHDAKGKVLKSLDDVDIKLKALAKENDVPTAKKELENQTKLIDERLQALNEQLDACSKETLRAEGALSESEAAQKDLDARRKAQQDIIDDNKSKAADVDAAKKVLDDMKGELTDAATEVAEKKEDHDDAKKAEEAAKDAVKKHERRNPKKITVD